MERRVVVVTGASSGIGRAIALGFGAQGWRVAVNYARSADLAAEVVAAIQRAGGEAISVQADVGDARAVDSLREAAIAAWGGVDVWINNAGADILTGGAPALTPLERLQMLLQVDVTGTFLCCEAILPHMRERGDGLIINMAWDHVIQGMKGMEAQLYGLAKGAIWSYSKSLARSVAPAVRVNTLAPGWVRTKFGEQLEAERAESSRRIAESTPMKRWGVPEDFPGLCLFLASPAARFITGQTFAVNGGLITF